MSKIVEEAVEHYVALLEFEKQTGNRTTRARNTLAQALNDRDLAEFAVELRNRGILAVSK